MKFIVEYAERGGEMRDGRVAGCAVGQGDAPAARRLRADTVGEGAVTA